MIIFEPNKYGGLNSVNTEPQKVENIEEIRKHYGLPDRKLSDYPCATYKKQIYKIIWSVTDNTKCYVVDELLGIAWHNASKLITGDEFNVIIKHRLNGEKTAKTN